MHEGRKQNKNNTKGGVQSVIRGCKNKTKVELGLERGRGALLGLREFRPVQTGSKAEPVRPVGINTGDIGFFFIFHPSFSLYAYFQRDKLSPLSSYVLLFWVWRHEVSGGTSSSPMEVRRRRGGGWPSWMAAPPLLTALSLIFFLLFLFYTFSSIDSRPKNPQILTLNLLILKKSKTREKDATF